MIRSNMEDKFSQKVQPSTFYYILFVFNFSAQFTFLPKQERIIRYKFLEPEENLLPEWYTSKMEQWKNKFKHIVIQNIAA